MGFSWEDKRKLQPSIARLWDAGRVTIAQSQCALKQNNNNMFQIDRI
jgi:hypothetical protein